MTPSGMPPSVPMCHRIHSRIHWTSCVIDSRRVVAGWIPFSLPLCLCLSPLPFSLPLCLCLSSVFLSVSVSVCLPLLLSLSLSSPLSLSLPVCLSLCLCFYVSPSLIFFLSPPPPIPCKMSIPPSQWIRVSVGPRVLGDTGEKVRFS